MSKKTCAYCGEEIYGQEFEVEDTEGEIAFVDEDCYRKLQDDNGVPRNAAPVDPMTKKGIVSGIKSDPVTLNGHKHVMEFAGTNPYTGQQIEKCKYRGCRAISRSDPDEE